MKRGLLDPAIRFLSGGPVLAILLSACIGWSVMHLNTLRAASERLQEEVDRKQAQFSSNIENSIGSNRMKDSQSELLRWEELAQHESQRIAALSDTAQAANVTLVSLRSLDPVTPEGSNITQLSHEIEGVGGQQQMAKFLDGIYSMEGMAAIDSLEMTPEDEDDPASLYASMRVTWFAPQAIAETVEQ